MRRRSMPILVVALGALAAAIPAAAENAPAVVKNVTELTWTESPTMKGARQAVLWGDPTKGAYGAIKKMPAGSQLAAHSHTADTHVVALGGRITLSVEGQSKEMAAQSYAFIPGGAKHSAQCHAGAECVWLETSDAAYDIKMEK